jgi:hypothetical protein
MSKQTVEQAVRELDELRREASRLDEYLRHIRLGRSLAEKRPTVWGWMAGVYGFGWLSAAQFEPLPKGMVSEFYSFIAQRSEALGEKIRNAKAVLEGDGVA